MWKNSKVLVDIIIFFRTEGIDLPESTIRGLRDKYLLAKGGIGKEGKTARKSPRNSKVFPIEINIRK